jgi:hypothetical protein
VLVPNESAKNPAGIGRCRIFATNRETVAGFSPQTAKPKPSRRNSPETEVRYMLINKTVARSRSPLRSVRIGIDVMLSDYRHWLEYDSVALAALLVGIGFVELIVLSF